MRSRLLAIAFLTGASLLGCKEEALTAAEALAALEEVALSGQAETAASGTVEICTSFTIGQAAEAAAAELEEFIATQLPCAEITLDGAALTVEYGVNPGNCTYHGQTYSGTHAIEIVSAAAGSLAVHHEWTDLANQTVSVSGGAEVTWSSAEGSRNVVHELTWTRLADGWEVVGSGDRTQTALDGDLLEGLAIEGARAWTSERGDWELEIDGVEMRWIDPVPQAGTYELTTPFEARNGEKKTATLSFARQDEDTIRVTIASGDKSFAFDVTAEGAISQADGE